MNICFAVSFLVVLWLSETHQRSYPDSPSYMAAVVQYAPVMNSKMEEDSGPTNAMNYLKFINKAANYGTDVIVFPESSLATLTSKNRMINRSKVASYIPDPVDQIVPCDDQIGRYKSTLKTMSCAARDYQIYVVINHREKVDCTPGKGCPADGFLIYNTKVAFDRNGRVIARYRKFNMFFEIGVNVTKPIPTTFKTDFGVTFGTFICFDLVFQTPALNLTRDLGVTDILYSTHWFGAYPFPFAVEAQAAWAYANDVNFMGSALSRPSTGSAGTGIYLGKQGIVEVLPEDIGSNTLIVAEIPKVIKGQRTRNIDRSKVHVYKFSDEEISTSTAVSKEKYRYFPLILFYKTESINLRKKSHNRTICEGDLCCNFRLQIEFDENSIKKHSKYYRYRFAITNRKLSSLVFGSTLGIVDCAIMPCTNEYKYSCSFMFSKNDNIIRPTTFKSIEISTSSIPNENILVIPTVFSQNMIPLNSTDYTFNSINLGNATTYQIRLKRPVNNLLRFMVAGRNFVLDYIPKQPPKILLSVLKLLSYLSGANPNEWAM